MPRCVPGREFGHRLECHDTDEEHTMNDSEVLGQIDQLVAEEQQLYEREGHGDLKADDRVRLDEIAVSLDRCWDLLRQRRARREFGLDPDEAQARSAETVEHYEQ
jgi:hypothetical protein